MPRQARLDVPGVLQHVIARGIERGDIFRDDTDRQRFVARFSALLVEIPDTEHRPETASSRGDGGS